MSRGESRDSSDPNLWNFGIFPASEELPVQDFPSHPLPEVGHVLLWEFWGEMGKNGNFGQGLLIQGWIHVFFFFPHGKSAKSGALRNGGKRGNFLGFRQKNGEFIPDFAGALGSLGFSWPWGLGPEGIWECRRREVEYSRRLGMGNDPGIPWDFVVEWGDLSRILGAGSRGYLGEVDGLVLGDALGVAAREHPAVAAVHLLRDLLRENQRSQTAQEPP